MDLGNGTTVNYGQPHGNVSPYKGDWGTDCTINGAAGPWDSPAVDNETGTFYAQVSAAYPVSYAGGRPGPDLYGDSILSINALSGKMNWFFQSTTHDLPSEEDCQWSAALINVNGRKEIAVPCRNYFYGLDAATGQLLWSYDPLTQQATGTNPNKYPLIGTNMGDQANMTLPYAGYPSGVASWNTTVNENAPAFDGKKTVFYFGNENAFGGGSCTAGPPSTKMPPPPVGPFQGKNCAPHTANFAPASATIVAIDASTGQIEWKNTLSGMSYRGGITYTGGIVFGCTSDGFCREEMHDPRCKKRTLSKPPFEGRRKGHANE